jgi:hypothetical protein
MTGIEAQIVFESLMSGENPPALDVAALLQWIRNEHYRRAWEARRDVGQQDNLRSGR